MSWTDSNGNLWLFGGGGYDSAGTHGFLDDLWGFDSSNWTWVKGVTTVNQGAFYGTQGTAAVANVPGAREGSSSRTEVSGWSWLAEPTLQINRECTEPIAPLRRPTLPFLQCSSCVIGGG